jgi:hypothetical protein
VCDLDAGHPVDVTAAQLGLALAPSDLAGDEGEALGGGVVETLRSRSAATMRSVGHVRYDLHRSWWCTISVAGLR